MTTDSKTYQQQDCIRVNVNAPAHAKSRLEGDEAPGHRRLRQLETALEECRGALAYARNLFHLTANVENTPLDKTTALTLKKNIHRALNATDQAVWALGESEEANHETP